jgi:hypothetical protein
MNLPRPILSLAIAFTLGYVANMAVTAIRFERNRAELQAYYQDVFRVGEDFDKITSSGIWKGRAWAAVPDRHEFNLGIPSVPANGLILCVQVDDNKRITKVHVYKPIIM